MAQLVFAVTLTILGPFIGMIVLGSIVSVADVIWKEIEGLVK